MTMYATYSIEDNKLRLYSTTRVDVELGPEEYAAFKKLGFKWASKQELFVAPSWGPDREDWLLEMCGEIEDEDTSSLERSADRAERFGAYRDKRAGEAGASADAFDAGPQAFGHQNRQRAERQARRHDRRRLHACSQWSKAEYWQSKTAGVISHALHKSSARVRRGRILVLEAEQRKLLKNIEEYKARYEAWQSVFTMDGADEPIQRNEQNELTGKKAAARAYTLANRGSLGFDYKHPRTGKETSLYSLITDPLDPITPREAANIWLADRLPPGDPDSGSERWARHYELRLSYERAMLAEEGGTAADADMEPGGWIQSTGRTGSVFTDVETGWKQIQAVTRSPATKKVTSVKIWGRSSSRISTSRPVLVSINIERLPEGSYRPPTEEEKVAFVAEHKEQKAEAKATKPKAPPLINPTDEDAQKLQDIWNARMLEQHIKNDRYDDCPIVKVRRMTQAEYSARSKGTYTAYETEEISENLKKRRVNDREQATVFKIRTGPSGTQYNYACDAVVILTDKPQKPLPWADVEAAKEDAPTEEKVFPRLGELLEFFKGNRMNPTDEQKELVSHAVYVGWAYSSSLTQRGFTDEGIVALRRFEAMQTEAVTV